MWQITARNVNDAFNDTLWRFKANTMIKPTESRNGPVLRAPGPVIVEYMRPAERLVFDPARDANHVFHLMEALWMLAGHRVVNWLLPFNSKFAQYAEDTGIQHGAYGFRWRRLFIVDQIYEVVKALREPGNRRVVMAMWHPLHDLNSGARDVPCNTHIYFDIVEDRLNMTVCNRSNDVVWGAFGANAVHFSMLQELIARESGVKMGVYWQFSNNMHIYTELGPGAMLLRNAPTEAYDPYRGECEPFPLLQPMESMSDFLSDCDLLVAGAAGPWRTEFFKKVAVPLHDAYLARKRGEDTSPYEAKMAECDFKLAWQQWKERRNVSK